MIEEELIFDSRQATSRVWSFLIEVYLICSVLLVSSVQKSDSVIHTYIYIFFFRFSIICYCKILSIVPSALH